MIVNLISFDEWMGAQPREGACTLSKKAWQVKQVEINSLEKLVTIYADALRHAIKEADDWAYQADGVKQVESLDQYRELIK